MKIKSKIEKRYLNIVQQRFKKPSKIRVICGKQKTIIQLKSVITYSNYCFKKKKQYLQMHANSFTFV